MRRIGRVLLTTAAAAALMSLGIPSALAAVPTISSFSPSSGPLGTVVTINGTSFTNPVVTTVTFPMAVATTNFNVVSDTKLTATVPSTASGSGPISVSNASGIATSSVPFTVVGAPTLSSFSPASGPVGTSVTINGTNFVGTTSVAFHGTFATFTVNSPSKITAIVPSGATTGHISVATLGGTATSTVNFTVLATNGRIVFTSQTPNDDTDIFTIKPDGTGLVDLTPDSPSIDHYPSWSPDGSRIAFTSTRSGDPEIYVMNADGSGVQQLTTSPGRDVFPSWSPDGRRIAFDSNRTGGLEIYTMNADGTDQQQLTFEPDNGGPKYSPDGTQIAFTGIRGTTSAVYTIPASGGTPTKLTPDSLNAAEADWSPDGSRFVFVNNFTVTAVTNIFMMNADGTGIVQLTQRPENELNPNWSPDGTKIDFWTVVLLPAADKAFAVGFRNSSRLSSAMLAGDIWVMKANGTNFSDITNSPGKGDREPDWGTNVSACALSSGVSMFTECDFGFETPILGDGNFTYATTGSPWTFNGSGISSNNSGFTDSQVAPQGVQVAFLQASSSFSQSISGFRAGTKYTLTFSAAQRLNFGGIQDFAVFLDNTLLGTFTPPSTSYQDMSVSFSTATGTHRLTFQGINTAGGDDTAFIDNIRLG